MKFYHLLCFIGLALAGCSGGATRSEADSMPAVFSEVATNPYTPVENDGVFVVAYKVGAITSWGSGFVVRYKDKDVLCTAAHLMSDGPGILQLYYGNGVPVPFSSIQEWKNLANDSDFFVLTGLPDSVKRWEVGEARSKSAVTCIGYPENKRSEGRGKIEQVIMYITVPIEAGASGGIVIADGKAIGIATHKVLIDGTNSKTQCTVLADALSAMR